MQTDYKLIRQVIEGLSMMNNKFMNLMLDENVSAAQIMLRVILKDDKIKVKNVRIQRFIQNIYGHSAQLDFWQRMDLADILMWKCSEAMKAHL